MGLRKKISASCKSVPCPDWVTEHIGDEWITDLPQISKLKVYADDKKALQEFMNIRSIRTNGVLPSTSKGHNGIDVDPRSIFDVQVKAFA